MNVSAVRPPSAGRFAHCRKRLRQSKYLYLLLLLPLVKSGQKISRAEGWALILVYLCYLAWLLRDLI